MSKTLAIYYEHPDWFRPLFAELDRRAFPYVKLDATQHAYDPSENKSPYAVVFNRMSPSAYLRGHGHGIFYTLFWRRRLRDALRLLAPGFRRLVEISGLARRKGTGASTCSIGKTNYEYSNY